MILGIKGLARGLVSIYDDPFLPEIRDEDKEEVDLKGMI